MADTVGVKLDVHVHHLFITLLSIASSFPRAILVLGFVSLSSASHPQFPRIRAGAARIYICETADGVPLPNLCSDNQYFSLLLIVFIVMFIPIVVLIPIMSR